MMRKKNRIKRKNLLVCFCKFVRAIFVKFGGISFSYLLFIYFSNTKETLFLSLFHSLFLKPVIIKHVE